MDDITTSRYFDDVPLDGEIELGQIDAIFDIRAALYFVDMSQVYLR